jgi:hypothetical protein
MKKIFSLFDLLITRHLSVSRSTTYYCSTLLPPRNSTLHFVPALKNVSDFTNTATSILLHDNLATFNNFQSLNLHFSPHEIKFQVIVSLSSKKSSCGHHNRNFITSTNSIYKLIIHSYYSLPHLL